MPGPLLVQSAQIRGAAVAFPNPVTAGNLLVACFMLNAGSFTGPPTPVSDTRGSVWAEGGRVASGWPWFASLSYAIAGGSGADTITVAGGGAGVLMICEVSGVQLPLTVDASGTSTTGGGGSASPPILAATQADILVTCGVGAGPILVSGTEVLFGSDGTTLPQCGASILFSSAAGAIQSTLNTGAWNGNVSVAFQSIPPQPEARITQSVLEVMSFQPGGEADITQSVLELMIGLGISCANPPAGSVGAVYSHAFPVGSGDPPYTWAIIGGSLPPGLVLDPLKGIVSGTPTLDGIYPFTVQVTDSLTATAAVDCSITISAVSNLNVRITLRGVKLRPRPCGADEPNLAEVPQISKVDRAL